MKVIVGDRAIELTDDQLVIYDGMTRLQRSVSLKSLEGLSGGEAYVAGGGKAKSKNSIAASASEILNNPNVKGFVESFNEALVSDSIMARKEMLERLTKMARTGIMDVVDVNNKVFGTDSEGNEVEQSTWRLKDEMGGGESAAICELTASKDGFKIKMHDQKVAMKQIADIEGFNAAVRFAIGGDKDGIPISSEIIPSDPIEAAKAYQKMLEG